MAKKATGTNTATKAKAAKAAAPKIDNNSTQIETPAETKTPGADGEGAGPSIPPAPGVTEQGKKEETTKEATPDKAPKMPDDLLPYVKAYPNEEAFYRTSDGQVFLSGHKHFAYEHQRNLDKNKEVAVFEL